MRRRGSRRSPSELARDRTGPEGLVEFSGQYQTGSAGPNQMMQGGERTPSPRPRTADSASTTCGSTRDSFCRSK